MFYIINLLLLLVYSYYTKRKHRDITFLILSCVHLFLIMGLRKYTVGTDSENYFNLYHLISNGYATSLDAKAPLWTWLLKGISQICPSYDQIYFLSTAFLIFLFIGLALFLFEVPYRQAIIVYFCSFFLMSLNANRTYLAFAMVFCSCALASKGKRILSILLGVAAIFVHSTAVVGLFPIACFVLNLGKKNRKKLIIFFVTLGVVAYKYAIDLFIRLFPVYATTIESTEDTVGASAYVFQLFIIIIFMYSVYFLSRKRLVSLLSNENKTLLDNISIILLAEIELFFIGGSTWFMQRSLLYLEVFSTISFAICNKYKNKYSQIVDVCVYGVILFLFLYRIFRNLGGVTPYLFYWQ